MVQTEARLIIFDEPNHTYRRMTGTNAGKFYTSVSAIIDKFKPKFDEQMIAANVAKSRKISKKQVLKEWKDIGDEACEKGTAVHNALEQYLLDNYDEKKVLPKWLPLVKKALAGFKVWHADYKTKDKRIDKAIPEEILFLDKHESCGTADLPIEFGKSYFDLFDFKTNKEITTFSKYDNYYNEPFQYLTDSKYTGYVVQLSLYAYMKEQSSGRRPRKLAILWIDDDGNFQEIPVPYMRDLAISMLTLYNL